MNLKDHPSIARYWPSQPTRTTKTKASKYSSAPQPSGSETAKFVPLVGGDADGLFLETPDERTAKRLRHLLRDRGGLSIEAIGELEVDNDFVRIQPA
jgi:hypothetical protein